MLGNFNYKFVSFILHENKGNVLGILTKKHRDHHRPMDIIVGN